MFTSKYNSHWSRSVSILSRAVEHQIIFFEGPSPINKNMGEATGPRDLRGSYSSDYSLLLFVLLGLALMILTKYLKSKFIA